jgi:hypothetical protein
MDMNFAIGILDAVTRDNLTETGDLVEIKEECERDSKFAGALANACGFTPEALARTIDNGISDIRAHHARMERRERRGRRW